MLSDPGPFDYNDVTNFCQYFIQEAEGEENEP